jgi:hypothetical protein
VQTGRLVAAAAAHIVLLYSLGAKLGVRLCGDHHQGKPMALRAFAAAMEGHQFGFESFHPLFQPPHQRHQTAKFGRSGRRGRGDSRGLGDARHGLEHCIKQTSVRVEIDEPYVRRSGVVHLVTSGNSNTTV